MNKSRIEFTAVVKNTGGWWLGWIEEIPGVNCQEKTRDELLKTLKITLKEAIAFNAKEAIAAAGDTYDEEKIAV